MSSSSDSPCRFLVFGWIVAIVSCWLGCSGPGPDRYPVNGQVRLDGQVVDNASIVFTPQATGLPAIATIAKGRYELSECRWPTSRHIRCTNQSKRTGEIVGVDTDSHHMPRANRRPTIPLAYQRNGKLKVEITGPPSGPLDFELTSKMR